jgi:hypothetical protein
MRFMDLTGQRFGRLTVIRRAANQGDTVRWECLCDCSNTTVVQGGSLRIGDTKFCGCIVMIHGHTKGGTVSPEYRSWQDMIDRCYNPKNKGVDSTTQCIIE